jgi:hypothetical protein
LFIKWSSLQNVRVNIRQNSFMGLTPAGLCGNLFYYSISKLQP